jgi:hypothetical protein
MGNFRAKLARKINTSPRTRCRLRARYDIYIYIQAFNGLFYSCVCCAPGVSKCRPPRIASLTLITNRLLVVSRPRCFNTKSRTLCHFSSVVEKRPRNNERLALLCSDETGNYSIFPAYMSVFCFGVELGKLGNLYISF